MFKFIELIRSDDPRTFTNLAIYNYKAFKVRNAEMYSENNVQVKWLIYNAIDKLSFFVEC